MTIGKGKTPTRHKPACKVDSRSINRPARLDPDEGKNPAAVALGRLGGLKGGKARASNLRATPAMEAKLADHVWT